MNEIINYLVREPFTPFKNKIAQTQMITADQYQEQFLSRAGQSLWNFSFYGDLKQKSFCSTGIQISNWKKILQKEQLWVFFFFIYFKLACLQLQTLSHISIFSLTRINPTRINSLWSSSEIVPNKKKKQHIGILVKSGNNSW